MPTYEYHCSNCKHTFEELQKITASSLLVCPKCQKETLRRGPGGGIGLSFKGTGFYITDYGSKEKEKRGGEEGPSGGCGCGDTSCKK